MTDTGKKNEWDPQAEEFYTKETMCRRLLSTISYRGWQRTIREISEMQIPFHDLKVAEVGCGTGTFSLSLALLGARITLLDYNEKALVNAQNIYDMFGCKGRGLLANCLEEPKSELREHFDLVISGGLAEHFTGKNRIRCIAFHKSLLRRGGLTYIGVPNRLSFFYWMVRSFRQATGTWDISMEIPFSYGELLAAGKKAGLSRCFVIGNASLQRDSKTYTRGLVSAVIASMPRPLRDTVRSLKKNKTHHQKTGGYPDIVSQIERAAKKTPFSIRKRRYFTDRLSAGLILFGYRYS